MGSFLDEVTSYRILSRAYEQGIRTIDLASGYGEGRAREIVGRYIRSNPTQDWEVWDKIGMQMDFAGAVPRFVRSFPVTARDVTDSIEILLNEMGLERIDLLQLHLPLDHRVESHVLDGLAEAREKGRFGTLGCCNHNRNELSVLRHESKKRGITLVQAQLQMSAIEQRVSVSLAPTCEHLGLVVVANRVFARGLLAHERIEESRRAQQSSRVRTFIGERASQIRAFQEAVRDRTYMPMPQVALAWAFGPGKANRAVIGFSHENQLDILGSGEIPLFPDSFWKELFLDDRLKDNDFLKVPASFLDTR